ncbi:hypothetical protein FDUTEX481_01430 [Tolypothrix sp. PCC 7601]|nr:hypothetical protein FDUTEX481_01430 [Tolypothrix sp. PCC 7601]
MQRLQKKSIFLIAENLKIFLSLIENCVNIIVELQRTSQIGECGDTLIASL